MRTLIACGLVLAVAASALAGPRLRKPKRGFQMRVGEFTVQHARPTWPKPPIHLLKGERMRITCSWHNTDARPVRFGPETTDEMCFIIAFFTRDDETEPVQSSQCLPAKSGLLCPFAPVVTD